MQSVYEISKDEQSSGITYTGMDMPDQLSPKTPQWYLRNFKNILTYYNTFPRNIGYPTSGYANGSDDDDFLITPVDRMLINQSYYLGKQQNLNYSWLAKDVSTNDQLPYWIRSKKITTIVDKMVGTALTKLLATKIDAEPLSSEAKSKMLDKFNNDLFMNKFLPLFKDYIKEQLKNPQVQKEFKVPDNIQEWKQTNYKDKLADVYINMAKAEWTQNNYYQLGYDTIKSAIINGVSMGVEHYIDNGIKKVKTHQSYNLIIDNRVDGVFGEKSRFVGVLEPMTLLQILNNYPNLTSEQRQELSKIASDKNKVKQLNSDYTNLRWWYTNLSNDGYTYKDVSLLAIKTYWLSPEIVDGEIIEELYCAEVIGNKYMTKYGKVDNTIASPFGMYNLMLPIHVWTPNMMNGYFNSYVSRITDLQDEIDLYKFKIREMVGRSKGKCYIIRTDTLNGTNVKDIIEEFNSIGLTTVSNSGVMGNPSDNQRIIETVDMTLDPNVNKIVELINLTNSEIENITGQNKQTLGQQSQYIGQNTASSNLVQASEMTGSLYNEFMNFMQRNLRYATNQLKNIVADGGMKEWSDVAIGDDGMEVLKKLKNKFAEDFLVYIKLDDYISEEERSELMKMAQMFAANTKDGFEILDLLKLMKAKTKSELMHYFEGRLKELKDEREQQMQNNMKMKQMELQQEQSHEKGLVALQEMGKDKRAMAGDDIKKDKNEVAREKIKADHPGMGIEQMSNMLGQPPSSVSQMIPQEQPEQGQLSEQQPNQS